MTDPTYSFKSRLLELRHLGAAMLEIQVTDASGRVVLNLTTRAGNQVIDISKNAPGVYWLRVKKDKEHSSLKLIKL